MCGITALVDVRARNGRAAFQQIITNVTDALTHRGPDDRGIWIDEDLPVALGQRRLSILDLSPLGHQPMVSHDGRYIISFNGEIYNYQSLRHQLVARGAQFKGHSDTEVLLEAISHWGLRLALQKCNGMFAIILWDRAERVLHLARDRIGKKPLYFGWVHEQGKSDFIAASELKAFRAHPDFDKRVSREALAQYMRFSYVPYPRTIYEGVFKLAPASIFSCEFSHLNDIRVLDDVLRHVSSYWSLKEVVHNGQQNRFIGPPDAAADALHEKLKDAVGLRMIADVPLGAFLSGGIDSSTIVALMQAQSTKPIKTFTIGFDEENYNEAQHAGQVAHQLGTEHTELYISPQQAMDVIPSLPQIYDEPFADSSQIPTYLVSKLARQKVTVALSGDGGDELFGGYNRYLAVKRIRKTLSLFPAPLRKAFSKILTVMTPEQWDKFFRVMPGLHRYKQAGDKVYKTAGILGLRDMDEIYRHLTSTWKKPKDLVGVSYEPSTILNQPADWPYFKSFEHLMMYLDTLTYLPEDILTKVDRASMAVSLEARNPILDYRVIEFSWELPLNYKIRHGKSKWPLRQILSKYISEDLINRPKMGFGMPIGQWLRGPLKEWAEDLLSYTNLQNEGYLDPHQIKTIWKQHQDGLYNWEGKLWAVLMFQAWLQQTKQVMGHQK